MSRPPEQYASKPNLWRLAQAGKQNKATPGTTNARGGKAE